MKSSVERMSLNVDGELVDQSELPHECMCICIRKKISIESCLGLF